MALVLGTNYGFVTVAPEADPSGAGTHSIDNRAVGVKDTSPATATSITEIGWWCANATEEANFEVGIYSDDGNGEPETLLHSDTVNAKGTSDGWKTASVNFSINPSTTYWIAVQLDNTSQITYIDHNVSGGTGRATSATGITSLQSDWGTSSSKDTDAKAAIYAVYETGEIHNISKTDSVSPSDSVSISVTEAEPGVHNISKSEAISLGDSHSISVTEAVAGGEVNRDTFWVNNSGTWEEFNHFEYFRVKKRQNQASEFEIKIFDISTAQKAYFKEQAEVLFFVGEKMILKGRIQNIEYSSSYEVVAIGIGMEASLLDKQFIKSGDNRIQYTNESAQTIANEINNGILTTASSGLWDTDFGNISMRFEHANRLNALAKTADAIDYYWWVSQTDSDDYQIDYINLASNQGETSSQKTFHIGSTSTKTTQQKDIQNVVNYVYGLGYGDGVNQLKTSVYAASTQSSFLGANIAATDSSILLSDATDF
ncbi:MAG: hypothetical protein ACTSPI_17885, partial [Candidatus Heimdallarchaeaceae archaeon]